MHLSTLKIMVSSKVMWDFVAIFKAVHIRGVLLLCCSLMLKSISISVYMYVHFFYWQTIWKGLLFTLNRYLWWFILKVHESSCFRIVENIDFLFTSTSVLDGEPQSRRWLTTPWQLEWPSPPTPHCFLVFWPVSWHFNRHVQSGFDHGEHLRTWARQAAGPKEDKQNKAFIFL